jgi:N-acetylneuraminate lyase
LLPTAPIFRQVMDAFARCDLAAARDQQFRGMRLVQTLRRHGGLAAGKAAMAFLGVDCGPVRLPLRSLNGAAQDALRADLESIGFFRDCNRTAAPIATAPSHPAAAAT